MLASLCTPWYIPLCVPGRHAGCVYTLPVYPGGMLCVYIPYPRYREACWVYIAHRPWYPGGMLGVLLTVHGTREACWVLLMSVRGTREACWVC